ncbi:hypothetical protein RRF57_005903 [Xylaria bambusicola]|uniref:Uncharacterized protein n=1 Tax=Xylaria bambusicola TaxID=326684 RepID=A0AAN7Z8C6_9PEZI
MTDGQLIVETTHHTPRAVQDPRGYQSQEVALQHQTRCVGESLDKTGALRGNAAVVATMLHTPGLGAGWKGNTAPDTFRYCQSQVPEVIHDDYDALRKFSGGELLGEIRR